MPRLTREPSDVDHDDVVRHGTTGPRTTRGRRSHEAGGGKLVSIDRFRAGKAYTVAQAARLADTSPATVRRWLKGYYSPRHRMKPVFGAKDQDASRLSFLELVELIVASRFRKKTDSHPGIALDKIRKAHTYARDRWGLPYPFASLKLLDDGVHILREFDAKETGGPTLLALDKGGQWALPGAVIDQFDNHLEFSGKPGDPFAVRWRPYGADVPIVLDPHVAGGQPTVAGRAITIETLRSRRDGGESVQSLADDYELPVRVLEDVLERAA
jgi:uncharacterized protein (DUF433 family)